jgi:hypothetical protein
LLLFAARVGQDAFTFWSERVVPPDSPRRLRRQRATLAARFGSPSMAVARQLSFAVSGWCALSQVLVLGTYLGGSKTSNHMRSMLCAQWMEGWRRHQLSLTYRGKPKLGDALLTPPWLPPPDGMALEPALEWAAAVAKMVTAAAALLASSPWQPPSLAAIYRHAARPLNSQHPIALTADPDPDPKLDPSPNPSPNPKPNPNQASSRR